MWEQVQDMLRKAALRATDNVAEFLPGLVGLLVILLLAVAIAVLARSLVLRTLKGLNFDQRAENLGFGALTEWSPAGSPSLILARLVMWIILFAGLLAGLSALDAALPEEFARTVFAYMPNVLAAILILILGSILSRYLARSVLIGAVNLQVPSARLLSVVVKWLVLIVAWAMALDHLGIGQRILTLAFGIVFGGVVLTAALAVGLGAKDRVRAALEKQNRTAGEQPDRLTHV